MNWRQDEDVDSHNQGRPETPLRTASLRLRTMEKALAESLAPDNRAWGAPIRGVVKSIGDVGSIRLG